MMRRSTNLRNAIGTFIVFLVLIGFVTLVIFGEHFLENFKSH